MPLTENNIKKLENKIKYKFYDRVYIYHIFADYRLHYFGELPSTYSMHPSSPKHLSSSENDQRLESFKDNVIKLAKTALLTIEEDPSSHQDIIRYLCTKDFLLHALAKEAFQFSKGEEKNPEIQALFILQAIIRDATIRANPTRLVSWFTSILKPIIHQVSEIIALNKHITALERLNIGLEQDNLQHIKNNRSLELKNTQLKEENQSLKKTIAEREQEQRQAELQREAKTIALIQSVNWSFFPSTVGTSPEGVSNQNLSPLRPPPGLTHQKGNTDIIWNQKNNLKIDNKTLPIMPPPTR